MITMSRATDDTGAVAALSLSFAIRRRQTKHNRNLITCGKYLNFINEA